jgi:hypothetical protein
MGQREPGARLDHLHPEALWQPPKARSARRAAPGASTPPFTENAARVVDRCGDDNDMFGS